MTVMAAGQRRNRTPFFWGRSGRGPGGEALLRVRRAINGQFPPPSAGGLGCPPAPLPQPKSPGGSWTRSSPCHGPTTLTFSFSRSPFSMVPFFSSLGGGKQTQDKVYGGIKRRREKITQQKGCPRRGYKGEHPVTFSQALASPAPTTHTPKLLRFESSTLQPLPRLPPSLPPAESLLRVPVTSLEAGTGTGDVAALGLCCLGRSLPLPARGAAMGGPRCRSKPPQRVQDGGPRQMGFGCSSAHSSTPRDAEP